MDSNQFKTIDIMFFWRVIKRFWLFISISAIVGACVGYSMARWVIKPTYQATALIFAWADAPKEDETKSLKINESELSAAEIAKIRQEETLAKVRSYQQLTYQVNVGNLLIPDLQALLNSRKMLTQINEALRDKLKDQFSFQYSLSVKPIPKTRFVEVSVQCHNKELAPTVINVAMDVFTREARELLGMNNTQVIDMAEYASKIAPRNSRVTMIGFIIGLLISGGIAFLIVFFDKSIGDLKELEDRLKLPVLGVLPEVTAGTGNDGELWQQGNKSVFGEAIRGLRVNVEYLLPESGHAKIFLITSVNKGDGKSSIISSLAVAIARLEKKVLLIDMDLRRPRQHRVFRLPNQTGLVDMLVSKTEFSELVHRNVKVTGLDILTSGTIPLTPGDLLASPRLETFLKEQSQHYDYIFLDAPPVLGLADPLILGKLADATIFACDFKSANVDKLRSVIDRLRQSEIKIAGLVLNRFTLQGHSNYYYYYQHYYYGYHYNYSSENEVGDEIAQISDDGESASAADNAEKASK